jgi:beta-N-acetylhexosaminidase
VDKVSIALSLNAEAVASPGATGKHPGAIVFGCAGLTLSTEERRFFAEANPYGFILFRRNIETTEQVIALVDDLRSSVGRDDAPVLIDQEGGRVARLGPPHWPKLPPGRAIGFLAEKNLTEGAAAARAIGRVIGKMLADLGIDVACAPVVDLLLAETHDVIGDRAFSADPAMVGTLAAAVCSGLRDAGVTPIIKHIPGHGRATADSHLALPRIDADRKVLETTDFATFRAVADAPWAMVAHCVYTAFDADRPASISSVAITEAIRGSIGYPGVLIADDIGMKALQGSLADNAAATLAAGCDLTLHCSGNLMEMQEISPAVQPLSERALERLEMGAAWMRQGRIAFDYQAELALLSGLLVS